MARCRTSYWHAFTLVEVLIVVVILGILATIVVPQFSDASQDAVVSTLRSTVTSVKRRIDYERQTTGTDSFPAAIDATWFASTNLPTHPHNSNFGLAAVETVDSAGTMHPATKVLKAGVAGAYWYNSAEGVFRARVADQGSSAATLTMYNQVNDSDEAGLGNYGGGGGGS